MEQKKPGFQTRVALERFEHVRDASFTSDGKGIWSPVTDTSASLWDAETGRIIFAPAIPGADKNPASAITNDAPAAGLAQSRILFREEQARTFAETATALLDRNRSPSFKWSLKVSSRADPPKLPDWRAAMPYRFLFSADEKLLLIEEVKDYLPDGLLVDLETGEDIARIKAGKLTISSNAARLREGLWFSESHPDPRLRALFITSTALQDAHTVVSGEVTALLRSDDSGTLIIGTAEGELYSCKKASPAPVLIGSVPRGPVKAIRTGACGRLIIATDGNVSFLSPGGSEADVQTFTGRVGDISADATLAAIVSQDGLSIVETPTGTLAWRVRKSFDRILFSCDGSSVYCMNTGNRSPVLEEFDALAGLPLEPPADSEFRDALARQTLRRFGEDEYITTSSRPDPFRWISGAGIQAESCHRGFPGKDFRKIGPWQGSFCYPGGRAKTYALDGDGKLQLCLQTDDTRTVSSSGFATGDLDVVFGPGDRLAIIARFDGEVVCHDTISGEQRWKIPGPVIRKVPSRAISSVLVMDSHLNVLEYALQRFSTLEVSPESLRHAELSAGARSVLTLELGAKSVAFSPDGTHIITASWDGTARIPDAVAGAKVVWLSGHERGVASAAFSLDGSRIVTASWDKTVRISDAATGAVINCLRGHQDDVRSAAFSPDGTRIVTASDDKTARIWDSVSGAEIARLRGHQGDVRSAAFSPDGTRIVTASYDKTARIWDSVSGAEIARLRGHDFRVCSAAFSPDGTRIVTASHDYTARIWNTASGAEIACLRGHQSYVTSAAFSPDGTRIVTAGYDRTAWIWDAASGAKIARLSGHERDVTSAAFSPDGSRIVTASWDQTARIWDAMTGAELACLRGHESMVESAVFSPDGTRIATADYRTVRVWDPFVASKVLTLGLDGAANLWDTDTRVAELGGKDDIRQARFSSCGRFFATADAEGLLSLCSSQGGETFWQVRTGHRNIRAVFPLPGDDGIRILVGSHIETWHREPGAGKSSGHQRVSSVLSVNGWPLRFVTDLASLFDLDEKTLAGVASNGIAYDGMRSRILNDGQKDSLTLHVPIGPLRAVHRKLRPGLKDLRAQELGQADLPVWRNAAAAFAAHAGAPVTVSLRIGAYAERLSFGRVLAWMKSGPLQMGDDAATLLSRILTRSDHLAIQTRTAALLGELMTIDLTTRLAALGRDQGVNVTRFSDRIFISGEDIPAGIGSFARTHRDDIFVPGRLLSQAVSRSGFRLEAYGEVRGRVSEPA